MFDGSMKPQNWTKNMNEVWISFKTDRERVKITTLHSWKSTNVIIVLSDLFIKSSMCVKITTLHSWKSTNVIIVLSDLFIKSSMLNGKFERLESSYTGMHSKIIK